MHYAFEKLWVMVLMEASSQFLLYQSELLLGDYPFVKPRINTDKVISEVSDETEDFYIQAKWIPRIERHNLNILISVWPVIFALNMAKI